MRSKGLTIVELLVTLALATLLMTLAANFFIGSSKAVKHDSDRVDAQKNLQGAFDIMTSDIRQAGENLDLSLEVSGISFASPNPRITVRRNIPALTAQQTPTDLSMVGQTVKTLPFCYSASGGKTIQVAGPKPGSTTAATACNYNATADGDHVNVKPWRIYFKAENDRPQVALLTRPADTASTPIIPSKLALVVVEKVEEVVTGPESGVRRISLTLRDSIPVGFDSSNNSKILLLDERTYFVLDNQLRLALGGQTDSQSQVMAFNVSGMTISAQLAATKDAAEQSITTLPFSDVGSWRRLKYLDVSVTGGAASNTSSKQQTLSVKVLPRNVESAQ